MLNVKSLREQVYYYLRDEMHHGRLQPGAIIDLAGIAKRLGISKTPLREALIQLEVEGFVKNLPRRGVRVAILTLDDVKNLYEIIGYLEGGIIANCAHLIDQKMIDRLEKLNERMRGVLRKDNFDAYYELNLEFHGVYVDLSDNEEMRHLIRTMKRRLYDFPRRGYIREWELRNCDEHEDFLDALKQGDIQQAVRVMRDVHWSFRVQEEPIRQFYKRAVEHIEAELAAQGM